MSSKVGQTIPEGTFSYVPYTPELDNHLACGIPTKMSTNDWKGKRVVLIAVPGAFTPTCHVNHLPPFVQKADEFKSKGVDIIAVIAANDPFVMSGWGRVEGVKDKLDLNARGMGFRTARYAMIIDDLTIKYLEVEPGPGVSVSGADTVLAKL